jgi:hypothetical protein
MTLIDWIKVLSQSFFNNKKISIVFNNGAMAEIIKAIYLNIYIYLVKMVSY